MIDNSEGERTRGASGWPRCRPKHECSSKMLKFRGEETGGRRNEIKKDRRDRESVGAVIGGGGGKRKRNVTKCLSGEES